MNSTVARPARRVAHRVRQIEIAARLPGADVEQPAHGGRVEQPQQHVDHVADPDEVALLLAIRQPGPVGAEQPGRAAGGDLVVLDLHHRDHPALVVLVRAIDVEELEPDPLRRVRLARRQRRAPPEVEGVLGPAVQVERAQPLPARPAIRHRRSPPRRRHRWPPRRHRRSARHGRRTSARCVADSSTLVAHTTSPSVAVVSLIAPRWKTISSGGWLSRNASISAGGIEPRRRVLGEVAPFAAGAQPVDDDRLVAAPHQGRLQVRADEAGAAGDQDHGAAL